MIPIDAQTNVFAHRDVYKKSYPMLSITTRWLVAKFEEPSLVQYETLQWTTHAFLISQNKLDGLCFQYCSHRPNDDSL
jgi:hypothetical protein